MTIGLLPASAHEKLDFAWKLLFGVGPHLWRIQVVLEHSLGRFSLR